MHTLYSEQIKTIEEDIDTLEAEILNLAFSFPNFLYTPKSEYKIKSKKIQDNINAKYKKIKQLEEILNEINRVRSINWES